MRTIDTSIAIAAPPARVWQVLTDFARYPEWNPFIIAISGSLVAGSRLNVRIQPPGKGPMGFTPTVLAAEAERELRWRGKLLVQGLFDGEHHFRLEPSRGGTLFRHGETFSGLLVPMLGGTFAATEAGFRAMNEALKRRSEA